MRKIILTNENVLIELLDDIVIMTWKTDLTNLEFVKKMVDLRLEITPEKDYLFVINSKKVKNFSKEVRDFLAGKKAAERVIAAAIVIDSMVTATLANFFLRVSKPEVITRLFSNEEDAISWLKTIDVDK
jgi:hypothetical protein